MTVKLIIIMHMNTLSEIPILSNRFQVTQNSSIIYRGNLTISIWRWFYSKSLKYALSRCSSVIGSSKCILFTWLLLILCFWSVWIDKESSACLIFSNRHWQNQNVRQSFEPNMNFPKYFSFVNSVSLQLNFKMIFD